MLWLLGGTNQSPVDNPLSFPFIDITAEKEELPQADNSLILSPNLKVIELPYFVYDKQAESQPELLIEEEDNKLPCQSQINNILLNAEPKSEIKLLTSNKKEPQSLSSSEKDDSLVAFPDVKHRMDIVNNVLETIQPTEFETIHQPESGFEFLIEEEEELPTLDSNEHDEFLEAQPDEDEAKSGKVLNPVVGRKPRRSNTQKTRFASICKKLVGFGFCERTKKLS